jgi:hypothetical protein
MASNTCSIGVLAPEGKTSGGVQLVVDPLQLEGKEGAAVLTATEELAAGAQVFIDYGEAGWRSSWEMLYTYGFVPGQTSAEWAASGGRPMYFEGISESDGLYQQKRAVFDALAGGEDESCWAGMWVDLQPDPTTCLAMAPLLRLAELPAEDGSSELSSVVESLRKWEAGPLETWQRLQRPLDVAIEARVATRIITQCEESLAQMPAVEKLAAAAEAPSAEEEADSDGSAMRARMAARVLLGERCALEACIALWRREEAAVTAALGEEASGASSTAAADEKKSS